PANSLPATLPNPLADSVECFGKALFDHLVLQRGRCQEAILRIALHQAEGGAPRAACLFTRLRNGPQPGTVDVRVAGNDQRRCVTGGLKLLEPLLHQLMRVSKAVAKRLAAEAPPVGGQQ